MAQRLEQVIEPLVRALDYELWHLELVGSGNNRLLRLYIDRPEGITLDDCEAVSREVSAVLDVEDPLPGQYQLEVSSPGMDRPLVTEAHFRRFIGEQARLHLFAPVAGKRRFTARIEAVTDGQLQVRVEDQVLDLALADVAKARLAVD